MNRPKLGSLFSGIGGLDLAVESFFDAETVWHCEFDSEPSKVLAVRWPGVPNLGDITAVDWTSVRRVEILCGGFPCPDLSLAGRRAGMRPGTRSGLWSDFVKAIAALRPKVVVIENVRGLLSGCAESDSDLEPCPGCLGVSNVHRPVVRALGRVLGDLAALGFDAEWGSLEASAVGAPHARFRVFVVAYAPDLGHCWATPDRQRWTGFEVGHRAPVTLLPTPAAGNFNDGEDIDGWLERRARVREATGNGNGFGTPLGVAVRMLPTPVTTDHKGSRNSTAHRTTRGAHSGSTITDVLLPTPQVADATGGHARRGGDRGDELLLPGIAVSVHERSTHGTSEEGRPGEVLFNLRKPNGTQEVRETTGGPNAVPISEDLLADVRKREGSGAGGDASLESSAVPRTRVRRMRDGETETARSSHRPESGEQRPVESGHSLRKLSSQEALARGSDLRDARFEWGAYGPAVHRWEAVLDRAAPSPTVPDGRNGRHRLNAEFCSWMMGYPAGWVTDVLDRNPAIKACGNGVVPQQAYAAISGLWERVVERLAVVKETTR